jgi:hypothetical protein
MGLDTGGSSNRTYLSISDGRIAKRVQEGTDGAVKCNSKDGTKVWYEKRYPSVTGNIVDAFKRVSEQGYGDQLCIVLKDGDETFQVQMPWSSRYSSGFFLCMPNINPEKPVTLSPWAKEVDGKKKTMLYIRQDKDNVEWAWTRENPGDMPEMKQMKVKGQIVWDDTERQEFFESYLKDTFLPRVYESKPEEKQQATGWQPAGSPPEDDGLPF